MSCLIVGANLAGGRAAEALREHGFAGRVALIGAEPDRPYERPPLSKEYIRGEMADEKLYLRPADWYEEQQIELRTSTRAARLDPAAREVELESGERIAYEQLLIATGCEARRLAIPGAGLDGVHYLRTRVDAASLAAALARAHRVVVVGAGFIGSEVAASARMLGREVTVLEMAAIPLSGALGMRIGQVCAALHRDHGVDLRLSCRLAELRGKGRVEEAVLADGTSIRCDLVVVGVGVTPAVGWLAGSGIEMENGVLVNEYAETNLPGVYAAGDVANGWNPLFQERIRVEHYDNAQNQGIAAARTIAGTREPYAPVPYFWSDQYDLTMQYVGHASGGDQVVVRGNVTHYNFTAFYIRDGRLRAAFAAGRPRDVMAARRMIQARKRVDPDRLRDEDADLRALSRS